MMTCQGLKHRGEGVGRGQVKVLCVDAVVKFLGPALAAAELLVSSGGVTLQMMN